MRISNEVSRIQQHEKPQTARRRRHKPLRHRGSINSMFKRPFEYDELQTEVSNTLLIEKLVPATRTHGGLDVLHPHFEDFLAPSAR